MPGIKRRDWLLLAIGEFIEPIQLQKTMFLFAMEGKAPVSQRYQFEPYNWGPYAALIYVDLESLRAQGLVEFEPVLGGWNAYKTTPKGHKRVERLREEATPRLVKVLDEKREWVKSRSFRRLLKDVYKAYPAFAERSLFKV